MRIAFRVDASSVIGTGHIRRCQSLAEALVELGAQVVFLARSIDSVAACMLASAPWPVHWLQKPGAAVFAVDAHDTPCMAWSGVGWQQDVLETATLLAGDPPDWLVVDHYAFDARWHEAVRQSLDCRLLVIDDVADRLLAPDMLVDPNWAPDPGAKYAGRLTRVPHCLLGPRYALLSRAYSSAARYIVKAEVRSIGVFMGGTDPDGGSCRVLAACRAAGFTGQIEVVSSRASPHLISLNEACANDKDAILTLDEPDLSAFFARHDLQIGAGGGATWERCCVGAPTIAIAVAPNQLGVVAGLSTLGAARIATFASLGKTLAKLLHNPEERRSLSERASKMVDGRGAHRVALRLMRDELYVRPATMADASLLHAWRNDSRVREVSGNTAVISREGHESWMQNTLQSQYRWLFIAAVGGLPVGSIRFDLIGMSCFEVSIYLDPALASLGLGPRVLSKGEDEMCQRVPLPFFVRASVISGNTASKKLFQACGYHGGPQQFRKVIGYQFLPAGTIP